MSGVTEPYYEALLAHEDHCGNCCLVTGEWCPIGQKLFAAWCARAAAAIAPIPTMPRGKFQA